MASGESSGQPEKLAYNAAPSAAADVAAGGFGVAGEISCVVGEISCVAGEISEEAEEGTPLKKVPSAGSAVFTLVARAGAVAGPPSRQTSGQFAAEHGMPTPPGSAR